MTIFSKIAAGEIPSYKVAADDKHYAFLDINPVARGHVLVIPRREVDYIFDLTEDEYRDLTLFARRVAKAIEKAIPTARSIASALFILFTPSIFADDRTAPFMALPSAPVCMAQAEHCSSQK